MDAQVTDSKSKQRLLVVRKNLFGEDQEKNNAPNKYGGSSR
jgi:hypothetical protein